MLDFTLYTPTRIVFGHGAENKAGEQCAALGVKKVLIHYGSGSCIRSGLLGRVKSSLDASGIGHVELGGVQPNPRVDLVYEGIELGRKEGVDLILAVGGGSVIDSAKAIAYGLAYDGDVWDFFAFKTKPEACYPVGVVLTIAAAGSETSASCILSKEDPPLKRGVYSDLARPAFALMNPELTFSLPAYQTACGCTDILMHTMERWFVECGNMQLTDEIAAGLMRTVIRNARILVDDPENYDARAEIMWAGSLSHNGLTGVGTNGGDWACHRIEHEISAMFDVSHGAGLAAIWGSWAKYVYRDCLSRFVKFATAVMGVPDEGTPEEIALCGIERTIAFFKELGMPVSIPELGISPTDEQLAELAHMCAVTNGGKKGAAKVLYENDMLEVLRGAM